MTQSQLIQELIHLSEKIQQDAKATQQISLEKLTQRPSPHAWNALECFEHLNMYIDIYNRFFEEALKSAPKQFKDKEIKRGYWGNKFINWMKPTQGGIKKMNTFKSKNPIHAPLNKEVIQHFISSNEKTIHFLKESKTKDIQKAKCKLAIPLLKLKLSDAFNFLISHNQRHMLQISRATK